VCVFSYAGQMFFGFGTDRCLIPDPSRLVAALMVEVKALRNLVRPTDTAV
jgi:diacylglycerol O-acyltransferase